MTAPARTTAATRHPSPRNPGGVQTRLPWWALALPAAAFMVLLLLLVGGGEANAAEQPGGSLFVAVLEQLGDVLSG